MILLGAAIMVVFCATSTSCNGSFDPIYAANSSTIEVLWVDAHLHRVHNSSLCYRELAFTCEFNCSWPTTNSKVGLHGYIRELPADTWFRVTFEVYLSNMSQLEYSDNVKTLSRIGGFAAAATIHSHNITLQWYRPLTEWYRASEERHECAPFMVVHNHGKVQCHVTSVTLSNLQCHREYSVSVHFCDPLKCKCHLAVGPLSLRTSMCSPGMVRKVEKTRLNLSHTRVSWRPPRELNGLEPIYYVDVAESPCSPIRRIIAQNKYVDLTNHVCKNDPNDVCEQTWQISIMAVNIDKETILNSLPFRIVLPCTRPTLSVWQMVISMVLLVLVTVPWMVYFTWKIYRLIVRANRSPADLDQRSSGSEVLTLTPIQPRRRAMTVAW